MHKISPLQHAVRLAVILAAIGFADLPPMHDFTGPVYVVAIILCLDLFAWVMRGRERDDELRLAIATDCGIAILAALSAIIHALAIFFSSFKIVPI